MFWLILIANFKGNIDIQQHFNTKYTAIICIWQMVQCKSEKFNNQYLVLNYHFCGFDTTYR